MEDEEFVVLCVGSRGACSIVRAYGVSIRSEARVPNEIAEHLLTYEASTMLVKVSAAAGTVLFWQIQLYAAAPVVFVNTQHLPS